MVFAVYDSGFTPCTKLVYIRALHEGIRGTLPHGKALIRLGVRAGVSRAQVFRAADEARGVPLNHLFVPKFGGQVKDPHVVPAFRESESVSNGDRPKSQIETGAA